MPFTKTLRAIRKVKDDESSVRGYEDDDVRIQGVAANRKFSAASRRDSTIFLRAPRKTSALAAITERRNKFEAAMLDDFRALSDGEKDAAQTILNALSKQKVKKKA